METPTEYSDTYTRAHMKAPVPGVERGEWKRKDYAIGVALFLLVILLWTLSSFITQILYRDGYVKPFLVTYASTGSFGLYLIPWFIRWSRTKGPTNQIRFIEGYKPLATSDFLNRVDDEEPNVLTSLQRRNRTSEDKARDIAPLSVKQTAKIGFAFCWLWFIANWTINAALNYTTVASSTILASTSGFFALGFGKLFGVEKLTMLKFTSVAVSFLGVVLVSISDSQPAATLASSSSSTDHPSRPLIGDTLALISALFYALYVIFLKVKVRVESRIDMQLFLGFVGLFDLLTCWPIGVILDRTGLEKIELPGTTLQWYALLATVAIFVLSDYLYILAMLKTTPLLVTVGISLTIPFAILGDFMMNSPVQNLVLLGAILVLLGFVAIALDKSNSNE